MSEQRKRWTDAEFEAANRGKVGGMRLRDHRQAREDRDEILREVRMAFRDLSPNITGPSPESVDRCRERLRAIIMQRGGGEFLT